MVEVRRIVYQGKEVDLVVTRQVTELMESADFFPLVGRYGNAVGKKQDLHESYAPRTTTTAVRSSILPR